MALTSSFRFWRAARRRLISSMEVVRDSAALLAVGVGEVDDEVAGDLRSVVMGDRVALVDDRGGVNEDREEAVVRLPTPASSRLSLISSSLVKGRFCRVFSLTKTPHCGGQSKYCFPCTVPSFLPRPTETPVNRTPTQSVPASKSTGPK